MNSSKLKKCNTCYSYGVWAIGDPCGVGEMDAADGVPTQECPECHAKPPYWKTAEGRLIPIVHLSDDHLKNIIKHIQDRDVLLGIDEEELLEKMKDEVIRREGLPKKVEITGTLGKINTREWNSTQKGADFQENQHKKSKNPQYHIGLKRNKLRWNKKKGRKEKTKKGSRDITYWSD